MPTLIGVSGHSPDLICTALTEAGVIRNLADVGMLVGDARLDPSVRKTRVNSAIFVFDPTTLRRNLLALNSPSYESSLVFLFSSPERIIEFSPCVKLDFRVSQGVHGTHEFEMRKLTSAITVKALQRKRDTSPVSWASLDYVANLIESVRDGSLLNPLMTIIYTLGASSVQSAVKTLCARTLFDYDTQIGSFAHSVSRIANTTSGATISEAKVVRLLDLLQSAPAIALASTLRDYRGSVLGTRKRADPYAAVSIDVDTRLLKAFCSQHGAELYEATYILSVLRKSKDN